MLLSIYDNFVDPVAVINADKGIVYCNEAFANYIGLSQPRILKKNKKIYEVIDFSNKELLISEQGSFGLNKATPLVETEVYIKKQNKEGRVQVIISPLLEDQWLVFFKDVELENALHKKYWAELGEKEKTIEKLKEAKNQLEVYSKNLEKMVEDRTKEIKKKNIMLNAIMNSLGQGFLTFNRKKVCSNISTKATEKIFGKSPDQKNVTEYLPFEKKEKETFSKWIDVVFSGSLNFSSLIEIAPKSLRINEKYIDLDYFSINSEESNEITDLVVVSSDVTEVVLAEKERDAEREKVNFFKKVLSYEKQFVHLWKKIESIENVEFAKESMMYLHTIEGEIGFFSLLKIKEFLADMQAAITENNQVKFSKFKASVKQEAGSFRNENKPIFDKLNFSESVIVPKESFQNVLKSLKSLGAESKMIHYLEDFFKVSLQKRLGDYNSLVESISGKLEKKINKIEFSGDDIEIEGSKYNEFLSSLVHIFRNICDHGIEMPNERVEKGKSEFGQIKVKTRRSQLFSKECMVISIEDDGGGVNLEAVREKAQELGFETDNKRELLELLFHPLFSTRDEVSEFSGRGVGLSEVKKQAESLGGNIKIFSFLGKGVRFQIILPISDTREIKKAS